MKLDDAFSFDAKTLIVGILTGLIVGYIVGQIDGPHEEIDRLRAERSELQDTLLQYRDACFELKDQIENVTTSYAELKEEYDELNAKYLDLKEDYNAEFFAISNLTIAPTVIELGQNVVISFYITNLLHESCDFALATQMEGPDYPRTGNDIDPTSYIKLDCITLGGKETKTVSYIEKPRVVGNYTVRVGCLTGFFQVLEKG